MTDWKTDFLESIKDRNPSDTTLAFYSRLLGYLTDDLQIDFQTVDEATLLRKMRDLRNRIGVRFYREQVKMAKRVLRYLKRKDLAEKLVLPVIKQDDEEKQIREKLLKPEEIRKLMEGAATRQDRLLISLLSELGARRGEISNLRIKDVQFDKYGAIINLSGKSGTRQRRAFSSVPDLRGHINDHPKRSDPNAKLFLNAWGKPLQYSEIYRHVKKMGIRLLGRPIFPHQFRHTAATQDGKSFTDRELLRLHGWKSSRMASIYSHLTDADVQEKDLVLHGMKPKAEILRPIVEVRVCQECKTENAPMSVYCSKCGEVLGGQTDETIQHLQAQIDELRKGKGFSEEDVRRMVESYLAKR